jgi:hypothetical protein
MDLTDQPPTLLLNDGRGLVAQDALTTSGIYPLTNPTAGTRLFAAAALDMTAPP